ncbi:MAG: alpha/beta fold hydrolase, partial [Pyrinomonadaceae bacterium]
MKKRNLAMAIGGGIGAAVAVKMLTRAKTVEWVRIADQVPHSDHSHFVNVDGVRLHYQEFGETSKPPIILIHGYTASLFVWHRVAPLLADAGFHVIAVDLVGFGYSSKPRWFEYTIGAQARMISRFMQRVGIGRATVVGSSYGGAVGMTLALDYSASIEKLVLIDTVCNDEVLRHPLLRLVSVPAVGEAITPFIIDSRALMRRRMRNTLAKPNHDLIDASRVANVLRPLMAADAHHSLLATSRNWRAKRLEMDAHLIEQPTLIIWGEDDKVVGIHNGYCLHDKILHSRFVVLRDCGHVPAEEKSETVSELIAEFCH